MMDETVKANYSADLAILSGLVYKSETIFILLDDDRAHAAPPSSQ